MKNYTKKVRKEVAFIDEKDQQWQHNKFYDPSFLQSILNPHFIRKKRQIPWNI